MAVRSSREAQAFTEFMSVSSASLFRTAYLIVGDRQLAQDLLQESLIKTYSARPRGGSHDSHFARGSAGLGRLRERLGADFLTAPLGDEAVNS